MTPRIWLTTRIWMGWLLGAMVLLGGCGHVVRLTRPGRVGDRVQLSATGSIRTETTIHEDAAVDQKDERYEAALDCIATVLAVDERGRSTRVSCQVTASSVGNGTDRRDILPGGTTVVLETAGGKAIYAVDGAPVSPEAQKALELVLGKGPSEHASDDDVFGSRQPRRVGESWPIDRQVAAADLARTVGGSAADLDVQGTTTLVGAYDHAGERCLELEGKLTVNGLSIPMPPGLRVTHADTQSTFWTLVPADPNGRRRHRERITTDMKVRASGTAQNGKSLGLDLHFAESVERNMSAAVP